MTEKRDCTRRKKIERSKKNKKFTYRYRLCKKCFVYHKLVLLCTTVGNFAQNDVID